MATLKANWMIASITTIALSLCTIFAINARENFAEPKEIKLAPQWYVFNGDPNDPAEIEDPTNYAPYTPTMANPEPSCVNGQDLCAVKAEPNSTNNNIPDETNLLEVLERNQGSSPDRSEIKHRP